MYYFLTKVKERQSLIILSESKVGGFLMPKKTCPYCGIVDYKHKCPVVTKEQHDRDTKREDKKIYWSVKWRRLREEVLEDCEYICLWSLYVDGVIREAKVCHHIIEIIVDDTKAYDKENVIGLNRDIHDEVHELYKVDKVKTMELLRECKRLWDSGVRLEGLGMLRDKVLDIER